MRPPRLLPLLLLGCTPDEGPHGPDTDEPDTGISDGYGVVSDCAVSASGGFDDFYDDSRALLVHGDDEREAEWAALILDYYAPYMGDFELRAYAELSEEDRLLNLFIMGSPVSNPLLTELNGSLPVWFGEGEFVFGGYRYQEPGHGLALIHPSPFTEGRWITLYAGNSFGGSYSTFTIGTGAHDYETVRGRGTVQQEGDLCRDGESWGFYGAWDEDSRAEWDAWVESQWSIASENHVFFYEPVGEASEDMDWLPSWQEERYQDILNTLQLEALEYPIHTYLYPDNDTKGEITGSSGNAHANYPNFEVHEVYGDGTFAIGAHEDVHVVAWHRWGEAGSALLGEGLAVAVDGDWWGIPLTDWMITFRDEGTLPPLEDLIDDFWSFDDTVTYPVAGHFVDFLLDGWGVDSVRAAYLRSDLDQAFKDELGMSVAELEEAWLATVE